MDRCSSSDVQITSMSSYRYDREHLRVRSTLLCIHFPHSCDRYCPGSSIVRELHVYGTAVPVHGRDPTKFQHQGFGTLLMEEAERIAREEHGSVKLAVMRYEFSMAVGEA